MARRVYTRRTRAGRSRSMLSACRSPPRSGAASSRSTRRSSRTRSCAGSPTARSRARPSVLRGAGRALPARLRPRARAGRRPRAPRGLDHHVHRARGGRAQGGEDAARVLLQGLRPLAGGGLGHPARAHQPRLHLVPARDRARRARSTRRWPRSCPATGSTGRWARPSSARARATRSTRAGSAPTPPRSSARWCATCSPAPTRSPRACATHERETMRRHFVTTSRYEWMFWDMGWRRETWPV